MAPATAPRGVIDSLRHLICSNTKRYYALLKMRIRRKYQRLLWYQSFGFLAIIALTWVDEMFNLTVTLFGGIQHSNWREALLETVVALIAWLVVFVLTRQLLARLEYVESFLRICPWCRKIDDNGQWIPVEEFFMRGGFGVKTTHQICPTCWKNTHPD
jgi:hypothetical protein